MNIFQDWFTFLPKDMLDLLLLVSSFMMILNTSFMLLHISLFCISQFIFIFFYIMCERDKNQLEMFKVYKIKSEWVQISFKCENIFIIKSILYTQTPKNTKDLPYWIYMIGTGQLIEKDQLSYSH